MATIPNVSVGWDSCVVFASPCHRPLLTFAKARVGPSSGVETLQQPGHILAEDLANQEEVVDRVEGVHGAGPADRYNRGADLALEHMAVGPLLHKAMAQA